MSRVTWTPYTGWVDGPECRTELDAHGRLRTVARAVGGPDLTEFWLPMVNGCAHVPETVQAITGWGERLYVAANGSWSNFPTGGAA